MFEPAFDEHVLRKTDTALQRAPSDVSPGVSGSNVGTSGDVGESASSKLVRTGRPKWSSSRFNRRNTDLFSAGACSFAWINEASERLSR